MKKFFASNISRTGRILRCIIGLALIVIGFLISAEGRWICACMVVSGAFVLYEAARGWCLLRACGVKTKL
jgi:uncharacterized membrane protein